MSEVLDDFLKNTYEDLFPLDAAQKVWAIRNAGSSDICVRKEVAADSCDVARRAMHINNIHIVNIRHIIDDGDQHYIVEDYIHGATLQELFDSGRRFGENEAVSYMLQLLDGLSALHGAGIVHRDISPKNVLLTGDGIIKLIDFGISHFSDPAKNRDTQILGTAGFAAPEQFGFQRSTEKADIYSAGALLNWMLTGAMPGERRPENPILAGIISKATEMDPKSRYASAEEMALALGGRPKIPPLPGFRTGKIWKKIIAGIVYVFCGFFLFMYTFDALFISHDYFREIMSAVIVFGLSPLILGNYGYFDRKIPVLRLLPAWARFLIRLALFFTVFWFGMEMYVGVGGNSPATM